MQLSPFDQLFRLRSFPAAKVSEISETTAGSGVPVAERINFHIGNPVQDESLHHLYFSLVSGLPVAAPDKIRWAEGEGGGWTEADSPFLDFLFRLTARNAPYLPRGGYAAQNPPELIKKFQDWLTNAQPDPLEYLDGSDGRRREMMIGNGGSIEQLRLLFHGFNFYLEHWPLHVLYSGPALPGHFSDFEHIHWQALPPTEADALEAIAASLKNRPQRPHILLLQQPASENFRRTCRTRFLDAALFFVESSGAANHFSLAREALLANRVLRILPAAAIHPGLYDSAVTFVTGPADFIQLLEKIHFELKGTPSAADAAWLETFWPQEFSTRSKPPAPAQTVENKLQDSIQHRLRHLQHRLEQTSCSLNQRNGYSRTGQADPLAAPDIPEIWKAFPDQSITGRLSAGLCAVFSRHHPEYRVESLLPVSGSARTALGLLGWHGGIRQVLTFDLSWTYEHCFPQVETVPLQPDLQPQWTELERRIQEKLHADPTWREYGAVVFNTPHNATGQVYAVDALREMLYFLLKNGLRVIDDLSYQNVRPATEWQEIATLRQMANALENAGRISAAQGNLLITVHSLSKTDSFAGARLAILEIRDRGLHQKVAGILSGITPNYTAMLFAYAFYRNNSGRVRAFYEQRNRIFARRIEAIRQAAADLPAERNPYGLRIQPPVGSMYPLLYIDRLPAGLSLDWLAPALAQQGIGMIPLSAFARQAEGYRLGRKAFRLTLGGEISDEELTRKTRRLLIDLNRLLARSEARYSLSEPKQSALPPSSMFEKQTAVWRQTVQYLEDELAARWSASGFKNTPRQAFFDEFWPQLQTRMEQGLAAKTELLGFYLNCAEADLKRHLQDILEREFYKDSLERRIENFRLRLFDRTVHPTQMYSIQTEREINRLQWLVLDGRAVQGRNLRRLAGLIRDEFGGKNVAIDSIGEADEVILDLDAHIEAEICLEQGGEKNARHLLSFWGDWDGSTRPSGQGHRLVAAVVQENISRLGFILTRFAELEPSAADKALLREIRRFENRRRKFWQLLNHITRLTQKLEKHYRQYVRLSDAPGWLGRFRRDPFQAQWHQNNRLEKRMRSLREERRRELEYYFDLNKRLRKTLHGHIPALLQQARHLTVPLLLYRDLLSRFVLTPRFHQKWLTVSDSFAIDTTVYNIYELNQLGARYGNPGLVLGLQVSMSDSAQALIRLDQKLRTRHEQILRREEGLDLPLVYSIPLFEDQPAISGLENYLDSVWQYAERERRLEESTADRFAQTICELFFAGSDLSQQLSQPAAARLYEEARYTAYRWLAGRGLMGRVRIKLGSGEPMQRQGGYYDARGGQPAFIDSPGAGLSPASIEAARFARTPLRGILSGAEFRTWQSTVSEKIRHLPLRSRAVVFHHVRRQQENYRSELLRAAEPFIETRLQFTRQGLNDLQQLAMAQASAMYSAFLETLTATFRQILYGRPEEVIGLHVLSYFISRSVPALRDRPTVRPGRDTDRQFISRMSQVLPMSENGSLLRAIGHQQAQTVVLGYHQLTTGLFRSMAAFTRSFPNPQSGREALSRYIIPALPVAEILAGLFYYQEPGQRWLKNLLPVFPEGSAVGQTVGEDLRALPGYLPLLQQELLRQQGMPVEDFFRSGTFDSSFLPALRPDLAVLLQADFDWLPDQEGSPAWRDEVRHLHRKRQMIQFWREKIWQLIGPRIALQSRRFIQLALAVHGLAGKEGWLDPGAAKPKRVVKHPFVTELLDDNLQQFLRETMQVMAQMNRRGGEVSVELVRIIRDMKGIMQVEGQALSSTEQDIFRFYLLQIARLSGENG